MLTRVSIVEDDDGVRGDLAALIGGAEDMECVSQHASAEEAVSKLPQIKPDVVIMDINLPGMSGIDCTRRIKQAIPGTQVLMLTMYGEPDEIFQSLTAGASGYLLKRTPPAKLLEDIQAVKNGASPMSPKIARKVVEYFQQLQQSKPAAKDKGDDEFSRLSQREAEILDLLAKGYRYKEIADKLGISFDTVRSHLRNIYDKLHVSSRTEAVVKYLGKK